MKQENLNKLSQNLTADRDDYMKSFRHNLDIYVAEKDITLREISEESGIPFSTLNTLLYGNAKDCKLSTVIALARALHISMDELVGAETISDLSRESLAICRNLPENALYLVRWFIRHQQSIYNNMPHGKKIISVMKPLCLTNGNLKPTNDFTPLDISHLSKNLKPKIFIGFQLPCDHYMPHYSPYDILLVANDRYATNAEHTLIIIDGNLFIAQRTEETENGEKVIKYYSIRDKKFRAYEKDVDEVIGYIACVENRQE